MEEQNKSEVNLTLNNKDKDKEKEREKEKEKERDSLSQLENKYKRIQSSIALLEKRRNLLTDKNTNDKNEETKIDNREKENLNREDKNPNEEGEKVENDFGQNCDDKNKEITENKEKNKVEIGEPRKRVKKETEISSSNEVNVEKIEKLKQTEIQRNRRMFGFLNSHLVKASQKQEQEKEKREKIMKIHEEIQEKEKQKEREIVSEELAKIEKELEEQEQLKKETMKEILKIENEILLTSYKKYTESLKPFTFTSTLPSLSWKPTNYKGIGEMVKSLFDEGEKNSDVRIILFEEKHQKIVESIEKYEEKGDYQENFLENEREFYKNKIEMYYRKISKFFLTKEIMIICRENPELFWKPAEKITDNIALPELPEFSKIISENEKKCEEYYRKKKEGNFGFNKKKNFETTEN